MLFPKYSRTVRLSLWALLLFFLNFFLPLDVVSSVWNKTIIRFIYKSGLCGSSKIYRPISFFELHKSKTLERFIKRHIVTFLLDNNLIHLSQHDFLSNKSCFLNLLVFIKFVTFFLDDLFFVNAVFLKFSKVFDKIYHDLLLTKLYNISLCSSLLN